MTAQQQVSRRIVNSAPMFQVGIRRFLGYLAMARDSASLHYGVPLSAPYALSQFVFSVSGCLQIPKLPVFYGLVLSGCNSSSSFVRLDNLALWLCATQTLLMNALK